jgi:hypothetical protein
MRNEDPGSEGRGIAETGKSRDLLRGRLADRRGLLRAIARGGAFGALLGIIAMLLGRSLFDSSSCDRRGICRGCDAAKDCPRPEAMSYRQAIRNRQEL